MEFFKFEAKFGKVYVLPPSIFFRKGGFEPGETLIFTDYTGKEHIVEVGPSSVSEAGETSVYLNVDHHQRVYTFEPDIPEGAVAKPATMSKEEILDLAKAGDMRAPFSGNICEISVEEGQQVSKGDKLVVMEAMKMQTPICSEIEGIVTSVYVKVGDALQPGDKVIKVDNDD